MDVAQVPEYSRETAGTIQVPIHDRAAALPGPWTGLVPTYVGPGILSGCVQVPACQNANGLDHCINLN
jgi:hypothetical protein